MLFLVGTFSLTEKSPTITVGSFFSRLKSHSEWSTFLTILTISNFYNSYLAYEIVFLYYLRNSRRPKGTPLEYFRLCETFFEGPPSIFLIFSDRMDVEKLQWVLLFIFFSFVRLFFNLFSIKVFRIHQYLDILKSFWYF